MTMRVPFFRSPWQSHPGAAARLAGVLASGAYVLGAEGAAFEAEFSTWLGGRAVLGVNSGTDALVLALMGLGIGPGDEVILPAYTFIACLEAVRRVGAQPVLVDCEDDAFLPGVAQIEPHIGSATRAVLAVSLFGETRALPAMRRLCDRHGLLLVEDVAQACGGRVVMDGGEVRAGMLGDAAAFSFYPTKILGGAGDGGAAAFRDPAHADRCRALRNHGFHHGAHREVGFNSRLDELQASLLRLGLAGLDEALGRRREVASAYRHRLAGLPALRLPADSPGHAWNYFVIRHPLRDALHTCLREVGVDCRIYYARPIHLEPAHADGGRQTALPNCEQLARTALALPLHADMWADEIDLVIDAVRGACVELGAAA